MAERHAREGVQKCIHPWLVLSPHARLSAFLGAGDTARNKVCGECSVKRCDSKESVSFPHDGKLANDKGYLPTWAKEKKFSVSAESVKRQNSHV